MNVFNVRAAIALPGGGERLALKGKNAQSLTIVNNLIKKYCDFLLASNIMHIECIIVDKEFHFIFECNYISCTNNFKVSL